MIIDEKNKKIKNSFFLKKEIMDRFKIIRDIPYKIEAVNENKEIVDYDSKNILNASCSNKSIMLKKLLEEINIEVKLSLVEFKWQDVFSEFGISAPNELINLSKKLYGSNLHTFIICNIDENNLIIDPTWNIQLRPLGFPVNIEWNFSNNMLLAVKPFKNIISFNSEIEYYKYRSKFIKNSIDSDKKKMVMFKNYIKFIKKFNTWLDLVQ